MLWINMLYDMLLGVNNCIFFVILFIDSCKLKPCTTNPVSKLKNKINFDKCIGKFYGTLCFLKKMAIVKPVFSEENKTVK